MSGRKRRGRHNGGGPGGGNGGNFWGSHQPRDEQLEPVRPATDPAALLRSLGEPPLVPSGPAQHHLSTIYEEAVRAATALAAANGLLATDGSSASMSRPE